MNLRPLRNTIAILGNGPSLKSFEFTKTFPFETLGMNAAYRFWDRIDWRPTVYACLDDALIETHAPQILRLIGENRIKDFFLTARILEFEPDLIRDSRVKFLDQFVPFWHRERGRSFNLPFLDAVEFSTQRPELLTTGSYAARFAAWLGYERLLCYGMDLRYEKLQEAESLDALRLRITSPPESNPNYFFDDYQKPGDVFHVPNPEQSSPDLHFKSFETLISDFEENFVSAELINMSKRSRLTELPGLKTTDLEDLLDAPAIGQIVIPYTTKDVAQIVDNFWLWSRDGFCPSCNDVPESKRVRLIFIANNAQAFEQAELIRKEFHSTQRLELFFFEPEFVNLGLSGDQDLYQKENFGGRTKYGWRAGPNNMFFGALSALRGYRGYTLYLESDCIPLKSGWLDAAIEIVKNDSLSWVFGSIYLGDDAIGKQEKRHLNGNAIYATSEPSFQSFVESVWRPRLEQMVQRHPELAFDCFFERLITTADSSKPYLSDDWSTIKQTYHRFRAIPYILNFAGDLPRGADLSERIRDHVRKWPVAHFCHSQTLAKAVGELRANTNSETRCVNWNHLLESLETRPSGSRPKSKHSKTNSPVRISTMFIRFINRSLNCIFR